MRKRKKIYSIIIPVYNSEKVVGTTIDVCESVLKKQKLKYEIIAINDGSSDKSWNVISEKAQQSKNVKAINFLRNYGQHTAVYCGLRECKGDYAITIDDDMQNPPEEIIHLVNKANEGHDLVFGNFRKKQHSSHRRLGTMIIGYLNKKIFHKPDDLVLTNFRCIRRDVIERICSYKTLYPYIPGLCLMFSSNPANVWVNHAKRKVGKSNYNTFRISKLVTRILFNYSSFPLLFVSLIGFFVSAITFLLGIYYLFKAIFVGTTVPGWATLTIMTSLLSGITLFILAMLGEYLVRLLNQVNSTDIYYVKEIIP